MVIFETWPADRGQLPATIGRQLADIAGRNGWSDHMRIDLIRALNTTPATDFLAVWACDRAAPNATRVLGLGQISGGNDVDLMEIGVAPPQQPESARVASMAVEMFDATLDAQRVYHSGRDVVLWTSHDSASDQAVVERARDRGFVEDRVLLKMHRPLPAGGTEARTRGFDHDRDLSALLTINNAAFDGHSEQGGWTPETFASRTDESWFQADGIRLIEVDGQVAGFCWVKIHTAHGPDHQHPDEICGEIYVIAVHPDFSGRGLGTQLLLAGMDWMVEQGATDAMLYVQSDNAPAVALYERLGYTVTSKRVALLAPATEVVTP